ncbi:PH domain-containing protein [Kitasatospora sp. NPDC059571]|uniref:PH domain-containing protein n=1 Tax=Kitasatospora sp. NPDC059571 TaxID=3346871 RepID=UPI003685F972
MLRIGVTAGADTLTVRNVIRTRVLPWDTIAGFSLRTSLTVTLTDGTTVSCTAVQPASLDAMRRRPGYAARTVENVPGWP